MRNIFFAVCFLSIFLLFSTLNAEQAETIVSVEKIINELSKTKEPSNEKWESAFDNPVENTNNIAESENSEWENVVSYGAIDLYIHFDKASHQINPDSYTQLDYLGKALNDLRLQNRTIMINGHTDSDGDAKYNMELSKLRALSIKEYLVKRYLITETRIKTFGYGESRPLKENTSYENKRLNRRVEIVAMP